MFSYLKPAPKPAHSGLGRITADMQKGESIVSIALAAAVLLAVIAIQRRWNPADLKNVASSAADFIQSATGIGQVPNLAGYERLKSFRVGNYRLGLYRASPAPLVFATGRVVIYDHVDQPVFGLNTLEGSRDAWTRLYDFAGRHGLPGRGRPSYTQDLTGNGLPDIVVGQYTGGDHCCTVATILELGKNGVNPIGRIEGMDGLPFEGIEIRKLTKTSSWQIIAHRPYQTSCGTHFDAADVVSIYAVNGGLFQDATAKFGDYFQDVLRQDLAKWRQQKYRNMDLLQTVAVDYAAVGQKDAGLRFFALNLSELMPNLQASKVDPNTCLDALEKLVDSVPASL